jgi:hypothetical protein
MKSLFAFLPLCLLFFAFAVASAGTHESARNVKAIPAAERSGLYTSNRAPLAPSPLIKLPIGSIVPSGLVKNMLELEAGGMTGHLAEISKWCKFDGNAWSDPTGMGHSGWEELPYWLKGYGDLGYVLRDETIIGESKKWIEQILKSQDPDGWFGPKGLKTSLKGKPDLWPNMIVLNILQSYYEYTADPRIIPFMTNYFRWELNCPDSLFLAGYWPVVRAGDNIESVYWVYNRTGEAWLLDVAKRLHEHTADWTGGIPTWHGVNISQGFREPAIYSMQAKDPSFLKATQRNYDTVMALYGQVPGGMFAADENARVGHDDPRGGAETCTMVEFMHSFEMLTAMTGDPLWADRCEEVAYNSFPSALTPDMKALHYITSPNAVLLDKENKAPGLENDGTMLSYSPYATYRCCQHNVAHGWPYFAENLWLATADGGLCASLYGSNTVKAKVGSGTMVTIEEQTDYPFSSSIRMNVKIESSVQFPLYLRVPRWSKGASVKINGRPVKVEAAPLSYIVLDRTWKSGDKISLDLPMGLSVRRWTANKNAASVDYGPLTFSLKIGEQWKRYGGTDAWPEKELYPTTPWNYGLVLDEKDPVGAFKVVKKKGPIAHQPFTPDSAPIELVAKARKISAWTTDSTGLVCALQPSPVASSEQTETVTLIPMGCARLRISAFPVIGNGPEAHAWVKENNKP